MGSPRVGGIPGGVLFDGLASDTAKASDRASDSDTAESGHTTNRNDCNNIMAALVAV